MIEFFRRLLGIADTATERHPAPGAVAAGQNASISGAPRTPSRVVARSESPVIDRPGTGEAHADAEVTRRYFELSVEIEQAKSDRDFRRAIRAARDTFPLLPAFVRSVKRDFGRFDISTSHAVHTAPTLMAVLEDAEGIQELRAALEGTKELRQWLPVADQADTDLALVSHIVAAVEAAPGLVQSALKAQDGIAAGSRPAQLAAWLEKAERIYRVKKGSSYHLYPSGYTIESTVPTFPGIGQSADAGVAQLSSQTPANEAPAVPLLNVAPRLGRPWCNRTAAKARLLDFTGLAVTRLPMAPAAWAERDATARGSAPTSTWRGTAESGQIALAQKEESGKAAEPKFVADGNGWTIVAEEKLPPADRPDPAFKEVFHTGRYTHWLDPKGKRDGFEYAASVLRVTNREGQVTAERGLGHDVYRSDVNAYGTGILFLSRNGVLHGYTEALEPLIEEDLRDLPEYRAQAERLGIEPRELKNHVRCVAISTDRSRYLVTVVDEAWCLERATGAVIWGIRMPSKDAWTRHVAERSERSGTSAEVKAAMQMMGLQLPLSPDDITRQYRTLAMRWHPDRNPRDVDATARFQELGAAMELLTGADLSQLSEREVERVTYEQVLSTSRVTTPNGRGGDMSISFTVSMGVSEKFASDWVYAANFGRDGRAFLAAYSGKVVVVSPQGIPERVYDVGAVPRHIADDGEHLYILTDTRLYVLAGDRLQALVDVYGAGEIIVADRGFGILEPKAVTWFSPEGRPMGTVRSRDPLRRVLSTSEGLLVETRQHRACVADAPSWWS